MAGIPYRAGVAGALHGTALPYGYSVTIWGTGAVLIHRHGTPGIGMVFLLAAGAAAAYGMLRIATRGMPTPRTELAASPRLLRAGGLHVAAIGCALGAASLAGLMPEPAAWPAGAFASTLIYLAVAAVELALREREESEG